MTPTRLSRIFRDLGRMHVRAQRREIACRDTTEMHCTLLTELGRGGDLPMKDLVARLELDKGWVSRAVEQLVQAGLVRRSSGQTDRRTVVISLTGAGRRRFHALEAILDAQLERVFARLLPRDRTVVTRALELLYAAYAEEATIRAGRPSIRAVAAQ
ncbi:MAG: MarR family winged helix-turn-helix transcriptional regulator [Longimicrobiales bacterium]